MKNTLARLSPRELATVLASLRIWQSRNVPDMRENFAGNVEACEETAREFGPSLDTEEISALCERLNFGDTCHEFLAVLVRELKLAERFMRGFEDDETQKGIRARLSFIRAAIAKGEELGITGAEFDNAQAEREGWGLFNGNAIQRLDDAGKFQSDSDALAFVLDEAAKGSAYHRQALEFVPAPVRIIVEVSGGVAHSVYCSDENASATVLDRDDLKGAELDDTDKASLAKLEEEIETLNDVL